MYCLMEKINSCPDYDVAEESIIDNAIEEYKQYGEYGNFPPDLV